MTDIDKLAAEMRAGALAATKGRWSHYSAPLRRGLSQINEVQCAARPPVVSWPGFDDAKRSKKAHANNASFIALCQPKNTTAILDDRDLLKADRDHLAKRVEALETALSEILGHCQNSGVEIGTVAERVIDRIEEIAIRLSQEKADG